MTQSQLRASSQEASFSRTLLHQLGFFGHYLHVHAGGRSGKQHILVHLYKGGAMSQRELLDKTCISSATLSEVLAKLETEGLIERSKSEADRRNLLVALTPEGTKRAQTQLKQMQRFEDNAFSCLSSAEQNQLLSTLERLAEHWEQLDTWAGERV